MKTLREHQRAGHGVCVLPAVPNKSCVMRCSQNQLKSPYYGNSTDCRQPTCSVIHDPIGRLRPSSLRVIETRLFAAASLPPSTMFTTYHLPGSSNDFRDAIDPSVTQASLCRCNGEECLRQGLFLFSSRHHIMYLSAVCLPACLSQPHSGPAARARVHAGTSRANKHGARALAMSSRLPVAPEADTDAPRR